MLMGDNLILKNKKKETWLVCDIFINFVMEIH